MSKHSALDRLRAENRILKSRLEIAETSTGTPEIDQLTAIYRLAVWYADPTRSSQLDITRSPSRDPLSDSGLTTAEGAATYRDGRNLRQLQRDITHLTRRWQERLTRIDKPRSDDRPRCRHRACRLYGRRQDHDSEYCKKCGEPLAAAKHQQA